jgi:hypothetical protein
VTGDDVKNLLIYVVNRFLFHSRPYIPGYAGQGAYFSVRRNTENPELKVLNRFEFQLQIDHRPVDIVCRSDSVQFYYALCVKL